MRQIKSKQFFQLHLAAAGGESDGCKRGLGWAGWQLVDVVQVASGARSSLPRGCHLTLACLSQWQQTHTHRQMYPEKERWWGGGRQAVQWLSQAHSRQKRLGLAIVSVPVPVSTGSIFISISIPIPFSISISSLHFIVNGPSMATCRITQHGYVT